MSHRHVSLYIVLAPYVGRCCMWPDQKVSDQGPGKTNSPTYGVAVQALLELTIWNSQQLSHHVSFYLLRP
jgi:hypothetical protein